MTPSSVEALIRHAATCTTDEMDPESRRRVAEFVGYFNAIECRATDLNVFVFHAPLDADETIRYRDVNFAVAQYDYVDCLHVFVASVRKHHPTANVIVVTPVSVQFALPPDIHNVRLPVERARPMYERVTAMCAYSHSNHFCANTMFLDSDAFLNASVKSVFDGAFDIGVTVRDVKGLMPVNEGVIMASIARPPAVKAFFNRYLATYDVLRRDHTVREYYGDIAKWRGGQLTLNAIVDNPELKMAVYVASQETVTVRTFQCDTYNYSFAYGETFTERTFSDKVIVHLREDRKGALDRVCELLKVDRRVGALNSSSGAEATRWSSEPATTASDALNQVRTLLLRYLQNCITEIQTRIESGRRSSGSELELVTDIRELCAAVVPGAFDRRRLAALLLRLRKTPVVLPIPGGVAEFSFEMLRDLSTIARGAWEPYNLSVLTRVLREGDNVLDVGAHVGHFAIYGAHLVGSTGRVIALEPDPKDYAALVRNIRRNDLTAQVTPILAALADTCRTAALPNDCGTGVTARSPYPQTHGEGGVACEIKVPTLDEVMCSQRLATVRLIKVDAEGAELAILRGGSRALSACDTSVLIEVHPWIVPPTDMCEFLRAIGYTLYTVGERFTPIEKHMPTNATNLFATRQSLQ